eukprot:6188128-Pleurochrysis_carterae.AAC.3
MSRALGDPYAFAFDEWWTVPRIEDFSAILRRAFDAGELRIRWNAHHHPLPSPTRDCSMKPSFHAIPLRQVCDRACRPSNGSFSWFSHDLAADHELVACWHAGALSLNVDKTQPILRQVTRPLARLRVEASAAGRFRLRAGLVGYGAHQHTRSRTRIAAKDLPVETEITSGDRRPTLALP